MILYDIMNKLNIMNILWIFMQNFYEYDLKKQNLNKDFIL